NKAKNREYALEIRQGELLVDGCDITGTGSGGVVIHGPTTRPVLRNCQIHDCQGTGVLVHTNGEGSLEDRQVLANESAGVEIRQEANPVLRRCIISRGKANGILAHQEGKGSLIDCTVKENALAGVLIKARGEPTLKGCKIHEGKANGILFLAKG